MKIIPLLALVLLLSATSSPKPSENFKKLMTLEGTWKMTTPKIVLYEQWRKVSSQELNGGSFKLTGTDTTFLEKVRLVEENKEIAYIPTVENQNDNKPIRFPLTSVENNKFTFENKQHDFPQRIIYNFISNDSIFARVEGDDGGTLRGSNYYFKRIK